MQDQLGQPSKTLSQNTIYKVGGGYNSVAVFAWNV